MDSVLYNGSMIGITMDFSSTEQYVIGTSQQRVRPTFVGSQSYSRSGSTSATTVGFSLSEGTGQTLPQAGDLVLLTIAVGAGTTTLISAPSGYTQLARFAASDTNDTIMYVGYKFMGTTPDTTFPVPSSLDTANGQTAIVFVFRGVDAATPIDVTTTTATGTNGRLANPPAITPTTENTTIVALGAAGYAGTGANFTSSDLTNFKTLFISDTYDIVHGVGYFEWTSGAYDPSAFGSAQSTISDSWCAVTVALRPALGDVPVYGNLKNSGIWNLHSVFETLVIPRIFADNVHPQPTDIFAWTGSTGLRCTLSRDTITTPFGNTPLKMAITGDDPYTNTWSNSSWNIAAAATGQTWQIRVFAKGSVDTSIDLFMFGANSSGVWTNAGGDLASQTYNITTEWKEYILEYTFANAIVANIQMRLDGTFAGGSGVNIWFDGLQVRRLL